MQRIYIDPGHGGNDTGATGNGLAEKDIVLDIGYQMSVYLRQNYEGMYRRMSRTDDTSVSLQARTDNANNWGADVFISIHANAFNGNARGFETYIHNSIPTGANNLQADMHPQILNEMLGYDASIPDRGQQSANFHVLRETQMTAILTENLFIDHAADAELLQDPAFISAVAAAHAEAVADYLGLTPIDNGDGDGDDENGNDDNGDDGFTFQHWNGAIIGDGDQGDHVEEVQERLVNLGYSLPQFGIDGIFGSETSGAVRRFQQDAGIGVDGIPGPETHGALEGDVDMAFRFQHWDGAIISAGDQGDHVEELQQRLVDLGYSLPQFGVDGIFGSETSGAVRRFQQDAGIGVDGIPGPETHGALGG
ncbi:N-acetylmuramoyl-L-alanine amidase [Natribacillus halophilus]|uniref:N-acetylmuramoyl-L-alanine amidase n=1 Tax=Natribacillus halophilus TaxID=549003 RepID=A0A1G8P190_9BACI|nr:N-acetylmuramoyl-L-alanine amidase [Natribacillus halophilus]SDI86294.1 N-acetylmuramoyl-L-alanine amidase [Natribacillus halophilus]